MIHNKHTSWFTLTLLVVAIIALIWVLYPKQAQSDYVPQIVHPRPKIGAIKHVPNPCGLIAVVCTREAVKHVTQKTILSTVYSYQAVAGHTDSSPCSGAMAGVDFCHPKYPIVANNCLQLGTKVEILGVVYTVADRMNKRYGCNVFDRLIPGKVTLYNQPVHVLTSKD